MSTLEDLLDTLGGSEPETEKIASPSTSDLVARLLKEAGGEVSDVHAAAEAELAEKTAEIGVIALTLAELEQAGVPSVKLASPTATPTNRHRRMAVFIKAAVERGHDTQEIAAFLRKQAGLGQVVEDVVAGFKNTARGLKDPTMAAESLAYKAGNKAGAIKDLAKKKLSDPEFRRKAAPLALAGAGGAALGYGMGRRKKETPEAA